MRRLACDHEMVVVLQTVDAARIATVFERVEEVALDDVVVAVSLRGHSGTDT
jgi:hypothetical protein